jgi:hypothetical protein
VAGLLLLLALPTAALAQSASPGSESPGASASPVAAGNLTIAVPDGAAPAGTTVTVVTHPPTDRPDELKSVPTTLDFFEVQPDDVSFSTPATVTRTLTFSELGIEPFDPLLDGLIVGGLFTRAADGTWSWLADNQAQLDTADGGFTITATTDHGGPIFAYIAGDLLVANEDTTNTAVGDTFRVEGQLRVDPSSSVEIASVRGTTSDETVAKAGDSYVVALFDRAEGLQFQCLAAGTVDYATTFAIRNIADVSSLGDAIGLGPTDVQVTQSGRHTCQ